MTSPLLARRRAEEFSAFLDGDRPGTPELERLGGVVSVLRETGGAAPRPDFTAALRERLVAEAEQVLRAENAALRLPARVRGSRERRLVAAASALVLLGGTTSMAAAAQDALPGEALYPIKRGLENAQAGLSVTPAGKGLDLLRQADTRLMEVEGLLESSGSTAGPQVPRTLEAFTEQARAGTDLLLAAYERDRDPAAVEAVRSFAARGLQTLQQLARTAPADAQDELAAAAALLSRIDTEATALCWSCAPELPALELPPMFLAAAEADRALTGALAADLDNSHPVAVDRRALERVVRPTPVATPEPTGLPGGTDGGSTQQPDLLPDDQRIRTDKDAGGDLGKTVDEALEGATDGLGGLVETLLPDPTPTSKLLP